ncbi:MAG TPA: EAL domain-containing protein [Actinomycetota bacterium]|nr:EAL domain-containing protein [Actinomycetota bacterium]
MSAAETTPPEAATSSGRSTLHDRRLHIRLFEAVIALPTIVWLVWEAYQDPTLWQTEQWSILLWVAAVAAAELLPVPTNVSMGFSLSFPLELSAAVLFPIPVAASIAFLGSGDAREFRRQIPPLKALFVRAQIALAVAAESWVFHQITTIDVHDPDLIGLAVGIVPAAVLGYIINTAIVAYYYRLQTGQSTASVVREMHAGVFGEFVMSYSGLALFSVLVVRTFLEIGAWAIFVFIAPLAFARQMFQRTHSLQEATVELARKQQENEYQALHDSLTGMPNRTLFQRTLQDAIDEARRTGGRLAVMLMDLDHFKEINDTLGHHFGDMLLKEIGPRLSKALRDQDMLSRLGGDEFGLLLPDLPNENIAVQVAARLLEELEHPISVEGLALDVSGSIGIALFPLQADDADTLLRRADVAMYAAKEAGGGYELYGEELDRHNPQRLTLIGQVRPAIENGEFAMFYQPKVRLADGRVAGAEALIRWRHPTLGLVPPDEFIPLVEKTVLLRPLTSWIVDDVLRQWRRWADAGIRLPISINVSPRSLLDQDLPDVIEGSLREFDVPPAFLRMELTEGFLAGDSGRSTYVLDRLADVGVGLSIDDFGTGYSSLAYLKRLPIEEIKIDRSFVMQMHVDANDFMIVRATVDLGRNLGLRVVAEGVEDLETFDRLAEFACDEAQGFYISEPLPVDGFTRWLSVRNLEPSATAAASAEDAPEARRNRIHAV